MDSIIGTVQLFALDFAPIGWTLCDGKELSINDNSGLYSLIGIKYGGNGTTTFKLPNLMDKNPNENVKYYICLMGAYPRRP